MGGLMPIGQSTRIEKLVITGPDALTLEDTVWDDLRVAASSTQVNPATSKPDLAAFPAGSARIKTFLFDGAAREIVTFPIQIPHRYKLGTDLHPHVHWSPTTTIGAKTVTWDLEYVIANIGSAMPAEVTRVGTYTGDMVTDKHHLTELQTIDGSGITSISTMLICALSRRGDTDTYANDVAFLEFDLHYEIDSLGSREEFVK